MAPISQEQLAAIARYGLAGFVDQYRDCVPEAVVYAILEHEDQSFDPTIYNYYIVDLKTGKKTDVLGIEYAVPDAPLVTRWTQPGDGGCEHDPHACGNAQILDSIRLAQGGYGGVKLPYLNDLFDAEKNIRAALTARASDCRRILAAGVTDPTLLGLFLYFAHAEGLGKLIGGKYEGAFARLKRLGKAITWANFCALPWGEEGWWKLGNRLSGVAYALARVPLWIAALPALRAGATTVEEIPEAEPDTRPRVDALIAEVQAAEMLRDLATAAKLREELAALVGPEGGLA